MNKERIENLSIILKKLNQEGATEEVRQEALSIVKEISPVELSIAEQNLIEEGMNPQELRGLCEVHMEVLKDELDKIKTSITEGHVLNTMIEEHEEILKLLKKLEVLNNKIQKLNNYDEEGNIARELVELADNILDAENHHQREEQVLFPEMEALGITGPTRIMKMEHEDLREKKRRIKSLGENAKYVNFEAFKSDLDETAKYLIFNLRDHIFKENYILYPSALETIKENSKWEEMKDRCDKIGYCGFTPSH
ncbi:DUF438 domain-containing protein [Clostridium sp. YIM B02551]|uniref:DUF438 domain-containing protein n=1 Tax=Clostridium sp. YIM B02551 TaxID=2910679 RepID=UPI001EEABEC3|nr:DUF438 domain-containing protein [Clostridium sp. YIM B02551]